MIVCHIITSLNDGGAEAVLFRLCMADQGNTHVVISMRDEGKYGPLLEQNGVKVYFLLMPRSRVTWHGITLLAKLLLQLRPDVVQTWMYHADLVGGLMARIAGVKRVFWGLHHTNLERGHSSNLTIFVARLNAWLSHWIPNKIVSCSKNGVEVHSQIGYVSKKFIVIPNGYDLKQFRPDKVAGGMLRSALSVSVDIPLLGMVARFNPQKDHDNLIASLGLLKRYGTSFFCVLVGTDIDVSNAKLMDLIGKHGVTDNILLLGIRDDIPILMNALDVHVLSSFGEAFPNVLCESMACETVCVTTDVGDARLIVGDTGWVVPPRSPELLAQALKTSIAEWQTDHIHWILRKKAARQRILEQFSTERMADSYRKLWLSNTK